MKKYDAIVIGTGQAGVPLAQKLASAGWQTAIIEKKFAGGTCVNNGCSPTKTIISSGRVAYLVKESARWGVHTGEVSIDIKRIKKRQNKIVISSRESIDKTLKETKNLELIYGEASFVAEKEIEVKLNNGGTTQLSANYVFINVGATPLIPNITGLEEVPFLTSDGLLELDTIPEHLVIIGAGYISLEFAQLYRRLGADVSIIEKADRLLVKEDEDVSDKLTEILSEDGVAIYTGSSVERVGKGSDDTITVYYSKGGKEASVSGSHLLIATGRVPATANLSLDKAGIKTNEKGTISVDEYLETNIKGVYALGDVKGGPAFTHIAYNDYVVVYKNLTEKAQETIKDRLVPYCMFTDPQLGRVGLSENDAKKAGLNYLVAKLPMHKVARAAETAETRGFMKAIVSADTKQILGATVIGVDGGEIMSVLQMAMVGGITYEQIRFMVFAHPLFSESLNNLFMTLDN